MGIVYVSLAAFGGGVVSALLGYLKAGEAFVAGKFLASVLRALLAGGAFAVATYAIANGGISMLDIVVAFLAGAGVETGLHRVSGAIKK